MRDVQFVDQTTFRLEASHSDTGDCYSACLATIHSLPLDQVPRFARMRDVEKLNHAIQRWLGRMGYFALWMQGLVPGEPWMLPYSSLYIVSGKSPRSTDSQISHHACVGYKGEIIHDPHPSRAGLADDPSEWIYEFHVKKMDFPGEGV